MLVGTVWLACPLWAMKDGCKKLVRVPVDQVWLPDLRDLKRVSLEFPEFSALIEIYQVAGLWREKGSLVCNNHGLMLRGEGIATHSFAAEYWDAARITRRAEELFAKFGNVSSVPVRLMAEMDRCLEYDQLEEAVSSAKAAIATLRSFEKRGA